LHLVDDGQKARKYGIDGLTIKLGEVIILPLVRLKESSFDLCGPLMIALKPHPDLPSGSTIGDSLKLRKQKTQKENTTSPVVCVVLINLILINMSSKHNVISILTNLPNFPINLLKKCGYANLIIGAVCSIE
jgi:hypothetical protein